jgi:hypothetical protein
MQTFALPDTSIWVADNWEGLTRRKKNEDPQQVIPPGPRSLSAYGIWAANKEVLVAHGAYNDLYQPRYNATGISLFKNEQWTQYNNYITPDLYDSRDFITITKNPIDGTIYSGSLMNGLFMLKPNGAHFRYYLGSPLDAKQGEPNVIPVTGMAFDNSGNLWLTQMGAYNELAVWTTDGIWQHFHVPFSRPYPYAAADLVIDDAGEKWYIAPQSGGLIVYNDKGTIAETGDDTYRQLLIGVGFGNLPSNKTLSIAKDKNGAIWVGTDNGIGIISCPELVIQGNCEAEIRIVQYDNFAGFLFQGEQVNALAVDGANRKWVGTNNGIWLLSPDADKIIYRFTQDNSPLPANTITKINIDPITGDVYIGTSAGLISYRSTAIDGGAQNENVQVFPNPIRSGYNGTIAVKGLVENADVRITDMSGQLVYRTTALGGQAVWNGRDYTGRKPQSGVYLIFITNKDGSQTHVGKMIFLE